MNAIDHCFCHMHMHTQTLKKSDVVLDVNGMNFEAAISINDWVYELKIGMPYNNEYHF